MGQELNWFTWFAFDLRLSAIVHISSHHSEGIDIAWCDAGCRPTTMIMFKPQLPVPSKTQH